MEQKIILFQGGTHGNFLERYLNVSCGHCENFDFFAGAGFRSQEDSHGAHNLDDYKNQVFYSLHSEDLYKEKIKNVFCYIYIKNADLYKVIWWTYLAEGEFGLNVINNDKNFTDIFLNHIKLKSDHKLVSDNISFEHFQKTSNGLREYFKTSFKKLNGFLSKQESIIKEYNIENYFYFEDFYNNNFDEKLKENLKIDIKTETDHHKNFVERKKDIISSEHKVRLAIDAFLKGQYYNLEDFCLYEQAYFDHLLEEHYDITLKTFYKQFPIDTIEYKIRKDK
jgi:hypothetical protein